MSLIQEVKDFRYLTNRNYPVKLTGATVSLDPVVGGRQITFTLSAVTDQAISGGGEMVIDFSFQGVYFDSQKFNLCDGTYCPISRGDFVLTFCQVLPVDIAQGSYSFKMTLLNEDGRQLSCVAFDFTIPTRNS